jgi:hypothetical protein
MGPWVGSLSLVKKGGGKEGKGNERRKEGREEGREGGRKEGRK